MLIDGRENLKRQGNLKTLSKRNNVMRYKLPPDYDVCRANPEAFEFFSQFADYSLSDFIPAQREQLRLWRLAFNRVLKSPAHRPVRIEDAVADAELLLYFYSRFEEPFKGFDNVLLLHPPTVFEKLEWALKNVLNERVAGNLIPFSRESRPNSVLAGMKRWSLTGEVNLGADHVRQETIKIILGIG